MEDSLQAERELSGALDNAYHLLERGLMELLEPTPTVTRRQATFLLRCARQLRKLPPKRQSDDAPILSLGWFGVEFIPRLHQIVATDVMGRPLETAASQLRLRRWEEPLVSKQLWEGEGSGQMVLPTQPSPAVFGFLHELVAAMSKAGEDVWTPAAVKAVKAEACNGIWGAFEEVLQGREVGEVGEVVNGVVKEVKEVVEKTEEVAPVEDETRNGEAAEAEAANPEPTVDQKENIPAESEPSAPEPEVEIQEAEPQEAAASPTSKSIITRDWTLQLLFDSLYLDEALHRKRRRGSGSPVISLVGKVDSFIGTKVSTSPRWYVWADANGVW